MDGETKEKLIAELKVLRASYYYILIDLYGNVPIVTDFKDTSLPQQSTRKEVFDFIVKEITENMDLLSETREVIIMDVSISGRPMHCWLKYI